SEFIEPDALDLGEPPDRAGRSGGRGPIDLGIHALEVSGSPDVLGERVAGFQRGGATVVLAAEGRGSLERAKEVLEARGVRTAETVGVETDLAEGFRFQP